MTAAARPLARFGAFHVFERNALVYRRTWRGSLFITFLSPLLYLGAMGLGLGGLVDRSGQLVAGVPYLTFLAPGILAAQAMNAAAFESTYPILGNIIWQKTYVGMIATPVEVRDLVVGTLAWIALRLCMVAVVFLAVVLAFGAVRSPYAVLTLPAAVLTGLACSAPIIAFAALQKNDAGFAFLFRFVVTPLFLFSGTFFPLERLPEALQLFAQFTPLMHGVALTRDFALQRAQLGPSLFHVAVLLAYLLVGGVAAVILLRRRLVN